MKTTALAFQRMCLSMTGCLREVWCESEVALVGCMFIVQQGMTASGAYPQVGHSQQGCSTLFSQCLIRDGLSKHTNSSLFYPAAYFYEAHRKSTSARPQCGFH